MRFLLGVVTGVIALSVLNAPARRRVSMRPSQRRLPLLPEAPRSPHWTYQRLSTCISLN